MRRSTVIALFVVAVLVAACTPGGAGGGTVAAAGAQIVELRMEVATNAGGAGPPTAVPAEDWPRTRLRWEYAGDLGYVASFRIDVNNASLADPHWELGVSSVIDPLSPADLVREGVTYTGDGDRIVDMRVVPVFTNGVDGEPVRVTGSVPEDLVDSTWVPLAAVPGSYVPANEPFEVRALDCVMFPRDSVMHADVRGAPLDPGSYDHEGTVYTYLEGWESISAAPTRIRIPVSTVGQTGLRYGIPFNVTGPSDATTDVRLMGSAGPNGRPNWTAPPLVSDLRVPDAVELKDTDDHGGFFVDTEGGCQLSEFWQMYDYDELIDQDPEFVAQWYEIAPWGTALPGQTMDVDLGALAGAVWVDLEHNYGYAPTSASSARLPVTPLILKVDEVRAAKIDHPLRFSAPNVRSKEFTAGSAFIWPANDSDGTSVDDLALPMGLWLRLHEDIDIAELLPVGSSSSAARAVATALKVHGMILADTGGVPDQFTVTAEKSERWQSTAPADVVARDDGSSVAPGTALAEVVAALDAYQQAPGLGRTLEDVWQVVDGAAVRAGGSAPQPSMQVR